MRTIETKVYKFEELSTEAKAAAIEAYKNNNENLGTFWQDDNFKSIEAVLNFFDVSVNDWSIDYWSASHSYIFWSLNSEYDEEIKNISGARLYKYIQNNYFGRVPGAYGHIFDGKPDDGKCIFTGYCADADVLDPMTKFMQRPTKNVNFEDLINQMIFAGLEYMEKDYNSQMSDEFVIDEIEANAIEFTEDGEIF